MQPAPPGNPEASLRLIRSLCLFWKKNAAPYRVPAIMDVSRKKSNNRQNTLKVGKKDE